MFPASWADFDDGFELMGAAVFSNNLSGQVKKVEMKVQIPLGLGRGSVSHGSSRCPKQGTLIKILLFPGRTPASISSFIELGALQLAEPVELFSVCYHWMKATVDKAEDSRDTRVRFWTAVSQPCLMPVHHPVHLSFCHNYRRVAAFEA